MDDLHQQPKIPTTPVNNNKKTANESIDLGLLLLDSFNSTISNHHHHHYTPCISCGCPGSSSSNNKRSSPGQHSQDQLISNKPNKLFLDPKETTDVPFLYGFSKIALPSTTSKHTTTQSPALPRCVSDPSSTPLTNLVLQSPPENSNMARPDALTTPASKGNASLPPRPPLRRSISGLSPEKRYSPSSSANDSSGDESSSYRRLRKPKDSMKEINQMREEIIPDELEDDKGTEENTDAKANKVDSGTNCEEAVCVERTGDCNTVHFKCPCGKGYQIILYGRNCYYKLM